MGSLPVTVLVELWYSGTWNDITSYTRGMPSDGYGIEIDRGRTNEGQDVDGGTCTLTINNRDGRFSPQNPRSPLYGLIGRNTPIRVTVEGNVRCVMEVIEWPQRWDQYGKDVYLPLEAAGVLRRLSAGSKPLESALRRHYLSLPNLTAYVPLEDPSDTLRDAANLVPGTVGPRYAVNYDRRPGFGQGDHPSGSAPLPEWDPIEYFGWSRGASVLSPGPTGWWAIQLTAKVPPSQGEAWLAEWATTGGTYPWWSLKITTAGFPEIIGSDQDDPTPATFTKLYNGFPEVNDDQWRVYTIFVIRNAAGTNATIYLGLSDFDTVFGMTQTMSTGQLARIRPRPMYAFTPSKPDLGLGHMAAFGQYLPNGQFGEFGNRLAFYDLRKAPVDGFDRESAVNRVRRLALEASIAVRIEYPIFASDAFDRVQVNSWGVADSGQTWTLSGAAASFDVNNGKGHIQATAGATQYATIGELADGEVLVKVSFSQVPANAIAAGIRIRDNGAGGFYDVIVIPNPALGLIISIRDQAAGLSTSTLGGLEGWSPTDEFFIRAEAVENRISAKVWKATEPEPSDWVVSATDGQHSIGLWGLEMVQDAATNAIVSFEDLTIWEACPSTPMGPQQIETLVDNFRQAQDTDHGILYETRDELGLTYVPLCSLYNQEPTLELDYEACHLGYPLNPEEDDRSLTNDVTVRRIEGTAARVVKEVGPLSIQDPPDGVGIYDSSVQLNLAFDSEVEDHAGWLLHLGTWPEARYSLIRIRNQAPQSCPLDPHFAEAAAALDTGKVLSISNLPIWLPPEDVRALVQGYQEEIDKYKWLLRFRTTPANPYIVGQWDEVGAPALGPTEPQRYDTCGSEITQGLVLNGVAGNYASTPDTAALDITGDLDVRVEAYHGTWRPGTERTMVAKYVDSTNNRSWRFALEPDGTLRFSWSTNGIAANHALSTEVLPMAAVKRALRVTIDVSVSEVRFFIADDIAEEWTQFGNTITAGPTSIFSSNAPLEVGSRGAGTAALWIGAIYTAEVRNSAGIEVANPVFTEQAPGTTNFNDDAGRPWTVNGAASIVGDFVAGVDTSMSVTANPGPLWTTTATFPFDIEAAGVRLRVTAISGVSSPQTFTIQAAPVNGIEKTIPGGTPIRLWQPARYAL